MKYFFLIPFLFLSVALKSQNKAIYYHDGEHHLLIDGKDVFPQTASIYLSDGIMFEYDAKIYVVKQTEAVKGSGKRIEAIMVNDRTKLKGWGIDFYVKEGESVILYFNGAFRNADELFQGVDNNVYGYGNDRYFRLNKYNETGKGTFEEVLVYADGLWWRDDDGQLYGLRGGQTLAGSIVPFQKGLIAVDEATNEYLWFVDYVGENARNKVFTMEVLPEAVVINISKGNSFNGRFFFKGKDLSYNSIEREMDNDKSIYYYDEQLKKAFYGEVPEAGQIMKVTEISVPTSESNAYWISDGSGQTYLQVGEDIWLEDFQKKDNNTISKTNRSGHFYSYSGPSKPEPWVLYPAKTYN